MASTTPSSTRYTQLNVRVTNQEKKLIDRRARAAGQTTSDYVRTRALTDTPEFGSLEQRLVGVEDAISQARRMLRGKGGA